MRFVHCADLHLGMRFAQHYSATKARDLHSARLGVLQNIAACALEHDAEFVVVAGDLFDSHGVSDEVVAQACDRLNGFRVPVYILPGNHDYYDAGTDAVYRRSVWRPADHVVVLSRPEVVPVEGGRALLYPARARVRREHNPCDWYAHAPRRDTTGEAIRVGVAHGATRQFWERCAQSDQETVLDVERHVNEGELDYLALGDWHGPNTLQQHTRAWYSGAGEPTSFGEPTSGFALVVTIDGAGAVPKTEALPVGVVQWLTDLHGVSSVLDSSAALDAWLDALGALGPNTCLRLRLDGLLSGPDYVRLCGAVEQAGHRLLWSSIEMDAVVNESEAQSLNDLAASDDRLGSVIAILQAKQAAGGNDADLAAEALRQLLRAASREDD